MSARLSSYLMSTATLAWRLCFWTARTSPRVRSSADVMLACRSPCGPTSMPAGNVDVGQIERYDLAAPQRQIEHQPHHGCVACGLPPFLAPRCCKQRLDVVSGIAWFSTVGPQN
jgi:hypothetical protein